MPVSWIKAGGECKDFADFCSMKAPLWPLRIVPNQNAPSGQNSWRKNWPLSQKDWKCGSGCSLQCTGGRGASLPRTICDFYDTIGPPKCLPLWSPEPRDPKAFLGWQTQKPGHQTHKPGHQTHIKAPLQEILMLSSVTQG